ncbi:MAG: carboxylate-amine ligase [Pseudomonadota bacterium]
MALSPPRFSLGIEEEYFLVSLESRDLIRERPQALMDQLQAKIGKHVTAEFLQAQIEIGTPVCDTVQGARQALADLRGQVIETAHAFGCAPIAASTHPFAQWRDTQHTADDRYDTLAHDLQAVVQRMMTCGMHVHVGIENDELRIDLMNQARYFLPHLLSLSTSSPFWAGRDTGLKSYRLAVMNEMPRTGLPDQFVSWGEYSRTIDVLVENNVIEDASKVWWDLRPSSKFPTLEMRITDVCTKLDDAVALAGLFVGICRMLYRLRQGNQRWRSYPLVLLNENRWRAKRYGLEGSLFDLGQARLVETRKLIDELVELTLDASDGDETLSAALRACRALAQGETSAERQRNAFQVALKAGQDQQAALQAVVDHLITETAAF